METEVLYQLIETGELVGIEYIHKGSDPASYNGGVYAIASLPVGLFHHLDISSKYWFSTTNLHHPAKYDHTIGFYANRFKHDLEIKSIYELRIVDKVSMYDKKD